MSTPNPITTPTTPHEATRELSPRALFVYFDALAKGHGQAEAERLAQAAHAAVARPGVRVCFDVVWRSVASGRERVRALVTQWFDRNPGAGHFFTDEACVCVALKPVDAGRFVRELAALDRHSGAPLVIARVVRQGPVARQAFTPRTGHAFAA